MTADFAGDYRSLTLAAPDQLAVELQAAYNKEWCDRPEVKQKIEQTLARWRAARAGRVSRGRVRGGGSASRRAPARACSSSGSSCGRWRSTRWSRPRMQQFDAEVVQLGCPARPLTGPSASVAVG